MQILSIELKNIKSHREAEFTFSPGINVLSGPNGAGKSTLFEAVGYALFGVDARDFVSRADRFVTFGEKRGEVMVTFLAGEGDTWRVSRSVGSNSRWLLARKQGDEFEVEEHAGAGETEARLCEILGLDRGRPLAEQFRQVIGPLQNDFLGPFVLKGARRQEAFDQILGIDAWRRTFEGTRDLQRVLQQKLESLEVEIAGLREQVTVLPEKKGERKDISRQEKEKKNLLKKQEAVLKEREKSLQEQETRRSVLEKKVGEVKIFQDRIENGRQRITEQKVRVEEAQKSREIVEKSRSGKEAFEAAEAQLLDLRGREKKLRELEKNIAGREKEHLQLLQQEEHEKKEIEASRLQLRAEAERLFSLEKEVRPGRELPQKAERVPRISRDLEACRARRDQLAGRRESLREGREKLATGSCPFFQEECRNLDPAAADPFAGRLNELEGEMDRLQKRASVLETELTEARKAEKDLAVLAARARDVQRQKDGLLKRENVLDEREKKCRELEPCLAVTRERLATLQKESDAFDGLEEHIAAAEKKRALHQQSRDLFQAHNGIAGDLVSRAETLSHYEDFLAGLQKDCAAKEEEVRGLQAVYRPEAHEAARHERDGLVEGSATLRQELKGLAENGLRLDREIAALEKIAAEIEARQVRVKGFREKDKMIKYLRNQVFRHVSARLSERFREAISRQADRLYRTIAESDEELEWGEGYQVLLRDFVEDGIRERSDDQLSGGQTMSAVVALRLALLQTIGARIAFFDEPTSNLDVARRENLARAFRAIDIGREEVIEHWYDQLFLISHDVAFTEITDRMIEL